PERLPLKRREWELLHQHKAEWTPPFSRAIDRFEFRRGLVSHVTMSVAKFAANARAMFAKAPTIHQVALEHLSRKGQRLRECEPLANVTHLDLQEHFPYDWIDGLLDCPYLTRLRHLTLPILPAHTLTAQQERRLCTWAPLGSLRSLNLVGNPLDSEELRPLA